MFSDFLKKTSHVPSGLLLIITRVGWLIEAAVVYETLCEDALNVVRDFGVAGNGFVDEKDTEFINKG